MNEITQDKYSPGHWGLDGRVLGFNDWIEMKHKNKWMLARINKPFATYISLYRQGM